MAAPTSHLEAPGVQETPAPSQRFTIFVTAPTLAASGADLLRQAGCRVFYLPQGSDAAAVSQLLATESIDAVISRTVALTAADIAACPSLRIICKHGVGVSNIDVAAATRRRIPVCVTPGANAQSVAEMTLGLMFAAARRISWMDTELRAGRWSRAQDGLELHGRTLGLLGMGEVGQRVAAVALALGMPVVAFDPGVTALPAALAKVGLLPSADAVIAAADVLSLHVPLTAATRGLMDATRLARMRRGAILINTARGEVVDEVALIEALQNGHLRAAGLDTMATEPLPPDSPLLSLPNVVLTPHVGGSTPAALDAMARGAAHTVLAFLQGLPTDPATCLNAQVLPHLPHQDSP
ncbi:hydroxyacid dehydrogenase [Polaromonas sp. SM01]|uniref:hydroxyacid dehydrogenase n=1 Tax=Polaromonas sp. SM01 TaxID=3085630 RepID=UPI00298158B5|nr:hydroxyacid dehydrogenase [Polaromonas sp. SM01]MDW5444209.1 hydroxyacid dehydrogenase [Polaromonas sp. SM01]